MPEILFVVVGTMRSVSERKKNGMSILAATYTGQCQTMSNGWYVKYSCVVSRHVVLFAAFVRTKGNDQEFEGMGSPKGPTTA